MTTQKTPEDYSKEMFTILGDRRDDYKIAQAAALVVRQAMEAQREECARVLERRITEIGIQLDESIEAREFAAKAIHQEKICVLHGCASAIRRLGEG